MVTHGAVLRARDMRCVKDISNSELTASLKSSFSCARIIPHHIWSVSGAEAFRRIGKQVRGLRELVTVMDASK